MKIFYIKAMNVETGHVDTHLVRGENIDHAMQRLESDEYISKSAPYGWEVIFTSYDDYYEI